VTAWSWVEENVVLAIHDEQLAEHGGRAGLRDRDLLQSALARPRNLAAYGDPDIAGLAAAYAFGLPQDHPFVDGNKRVAFIVAELFLDLNGYALSANDEECVLTMLRLADGALSEPALARWMRERLAPATD
jgi:death on curing protein